jgi:hypothetical protein
MNRTHASLAATLAFSLRMRKKPVVSMGFLFARQGWSRNA